MLVHCARRMVLVVLAALSLLGLFAESQHATARTNFFDEQRNVLTVAPIIEKAAAAVVNISVRSRVPGADNPLYRDPFFRRFLGIPDNLPDREVLSAGSGVIVDAKKGLVLTNHHVVDNAKNITVRLHDGRRFKAKLIGSDPGTDIALLKIEAKPLTDLRIGDSDALKVGDFVIAIGNPFGLGQTVTSGIVSALGRSGISREKYEDFIQTDAAINPGNSGGALINTKGELVGINSAIIAPGGGNVGIGFAVPIKMAQAVMSQLLRHGEVRRGQIGVVIQDVTSDIAEALGLSVKSGALISQVTKGSPAETAGLRSGDVITAIDGQKVANGKDVRNAVGLRERGTRLKLTVIRDAKEQTFSVRVGRRSVTSLEGGSAIPQLAGVRITEIPENHSRKGDELGVYVASVEAGSTAWRHGVRQGDIILAVNRRAVSSVADFERVAKASPGVLALGILRGNARLFIVVQ